MPIKLPGASLKDLLVSTSCTRKSVCRPVEHAPLLQLVVSCTTLLKEPLVDDASLMDDEWYDMKKEYVGPENGVRDHISENYF